MARRSTRGSGLQWLAAGVGLAAGAYGAYAGMAWSRYGRPQAPDAGEEDDLLDRFMPEYDVVERHHAPVGAPADTTLAVARDMDLFDLPAVRAVFKGRELILGSAPDERRRPHGLLAEVQALGWQVLAEVPGREIVVGAVTRPWEANVTFRPVPPAEFTAFAEPDYVKIAWTLRADPVDRATSVFRTETRALATDAAARTKFRRYWSLLSPGILLIRRFMLRPLKAEAERRWQETARAGTPPAAGPQA